MLAHAAQVLQAAGASTYFLLVALELPIQTAVLADGRGDG